MRALICLAIFVVAAFARPPNTGRTFRPDDNEYDALTRADASQACVVSTAQVSGTACVVYNPLGKNIHVSVLHDGYTKWVTSLSITTTGTNVVFTKGAANTRVELGRLPITAATNRLDLSGLNRQDGNPDGTALITVVLTLTDPMGNTQTGTWTFSYFDLTTTLSSPVRLGNERNAARRKQQPTFIQTFAPLGARVLLSRFTVPGADRQTWANEQLVVVAVGPGVTEVSEGQIVLARLGSCFTRLVKLNSQYGPVDDVLTFSPYCWVQVTDILGIVSEVSNGANRNQAQVAHIKQPNPTGWIWAPNNVYQGFF